MKNFPRRSARALLEGKRHEQKYYGLSGDHRGEPRRMKIATTILKDKLRELV